MKDQMRWTMWQADLNRHDTECRLTQQRKAQNALDDVAGNICRVLLSSGIPARRAGRFPDSLQVSVSAQLSANTAIFPPFSTQLPARRQIGGVCLVSPTWAATAVFRP
jgi:hypothetical protein